MTDETPDWYDESKVVKAIYAEGYSGWVVDLGDGTCRFSNAPLLGEGGPEWGDRVDLFYNPCAPFELPRVGYRVYADGEEPTGRSFGIKRDPDEEETAEHKRLREIREKQQVERIEANYDSMFGRLGPWRDAMKYSTSVLRYFELFDFVTEQGIEVPKDLHGREDFADNEDADNEARRKELKTMLIAMLQTNFADIEVTDSEIQETVEAYRSSKVKQAALEARIEKELKQTDQPENEDDDGLPSL